LEKIWGCKLLYLQKIWKEKLHNSQLLMSYFPGWDWPCHNMLTICSTFLMELLKGVEKENTKCWAQWQYTLTSEKKKRVTFQGLFKCFKVLTWSLCWPLSTVILLRYSNTKSSNWLKLQAISYFLSKDQIKASG
jgi:hypothetical protein